jgi:hypothetical protein
MRDERDIERISSRDQRHFGRELTSLGPRPHQIWRSHAENLSSDIMGRFVPVAGDPSAPIAHRVLNVETIARAGAAQMLAHHIAVAADVSARPAADRLRLTVCKDDPPVAEPGARHARKRPGCGIRRGQVRAWVRVRHRNAAEMGADAHQHAVFRLDQKMPVIDGHQVRNQSIGRTKREYSRISGGQWADKSHVSLRATGGSANVSSSRDFQREEEHISKGYIS